MDGSAATISFGRPVLPPEVITFHDTPKLQQLQEETTLPLIGFFLLPWTTLGYTVMWVAGSHGVNGFEWFIVILAFLIDLGSWANRGRARRD